VKDIETQHHPDLAEAINKASSAQVENLVEIDVERYQVYLDDSALSPGQKGEFIGALWTIISAFVELGFGVHPVQLACGKHGTELENKDNSESTGVLSNQGKQQEKDAPAP